jgi:hypothetical protein
MLQGWTVEAAVGWDEARLDAKADFRQSYEPLLVLRHHGNTDAQAADIAANSPAAVDSRLRTEHGEL